MPEKTKNPLVSRRLAAILAADIAGYSKLMGADEEGTVRDLKAHQAVILPMISDHGGRVIDTAGDGILAEFGSVLNAIKCAVALQKTMAERNTGVDDARRMQFRIGINQGDVVSDETRIYGDGINVAARLEALSEPGGICISGKVFDEIRGKVDLHLTDIGDQELKNITHPVRAYRVGDLAGASPKAQAVAHHRGASPKRKSLPAMLLGLMGLSKRSSAGSGKATRASTGGPELPSLSIVVLPFANLSADPDQDYFADGLTEDLTTDLSRISGSFVIARNTAFTFKGKATDVRQLGRELGVRYVLEGSVRRIEDQVRVNAQLIDAVSGAHVWAERVDGDLIRFGRLQDVITARLARALDLQLVEAESRRAQRERPNNPGAVDLAMRGQVLMNRYRSRESLTEARALFEKALKLDPDLPNALIGHSRALSNLVTARWVTDIEQDAAKADDAANRVLASYPDNAEAHLAKGEALKALKRHDAAIVECNAAIALNPNLAPAYSSLGSACIFAGKAEDAFEPLKMAIRISPRDPYLNFTYGQIGHAHEHLAQHEKAIEWGTKSVAIAPYWVAYIDLISAYGWTCQKRLAQEAIGELHKLMPNFTVRTWVTGGWSDSPVFIAQAQMMAEGLRRGGLPEG